MKYGRSQKWTAGGRKQASAILKKAQAERKVREKKVTALNNIVESMNSVTNIYVLSETS